MKYSSGHEKLPNLLACQQQNNAFSVGQKCNACEHNFQNRSRSQSDYIYCKHHLYTAHIWKKDEPLQKMKSENFQVIENFIVITKDIIWLKYILQYQVLLVLS